MEAWGQVCRGNTLEGLKIMRASTRCSHRLRCVWPGTDLRDASILEVAVRVFRYSRKTAWRAARCVEQRCGYLRGKRSVDHNPGMFLPPFSLERCKAPSSDV